MLESGFLFFPWDYEPVRGMAVQSAGPIAKGIIPTLAYICQDAGDCLLRGYWSAEKQLQVFEQGGWNWHRV
jgi:hypothetical protein